MQETPVQLQWWRAEVLDQPERVFNGSSMEFLNLSKVSASEAAEVTRRRGNARERKRKVAIGGENEGLFSANGVSLQLLRVEFWNVFRCWLEI